MMALIQQYYFWLILTSLFCFLLERIWKWRPEQKLLREGFFQDIFWLLFNGHILSLILAVFTGKLIFAVNTLFFQVHLPKPETLQLLTHMSLWMQGFLFFTFKDFLEWNIHRLLHSQPKLWELHKLHHSITELDWIGNFRFHWGEIVVYKTLSYLPLVILGVDNRILLVSAVVSTLMQNLNHANLPIDWGVFKYIFNSPKMHVWHHDVALHKEHGQNFAIVLSIWDWLFKTVYWPNTPDQPEKTGFQDMEQFPKTLIGRLFYPLSSTRINDPGS